MKNNVPISVVMPAYNAEQYIREAIDSVLAQSFTDFELVVINDGSTDGTADIVSSYKDSRIQLVNNPSNQGAIKSMNQAFERVEGKYIARMDADDKAMPNRLNVQFDFLEKNCDVSILGSFYQHMGTSEVIRQPESDDEIRIKFLLNNSLAHPTIMIRRQEILDKGLRYDEDFRYADDYQFWIKSIKKGVKFANVPEVLLDYRVHEGQISSARRQEQFEESVLSRREYVSFINDGTLSSDDIEIVGSQLTNNDIKARLTTINNLIKLNKRTNYFIQINYQRFLWFCLNDLFGKKDLFYCLKSKEFEANFIFWLGRNYFLKLVRNIFGIKNRNEAMY